MAEAKSQATAEKPAYKKSPNKKPTTASKSTKVNQKPVSDTVAPAKAVPVLERIPAEHVVVGGKVLLKLGQSPMLATVLEISKDDVTVQLGSGMVIKTRQDSLYIA
ncbi:MAG: ProP effector [Rheinheimera aquimaris]